MRKISILLATILFTLSLNAQSFKADFTKALRDGNTDKQKEILSLWEKSNDRSADYYIANFNYYLTSCVDEQTRKLDIEKLGRSLDAIDEGIDKYPNRLDIRQGKVFALKQMAMWDDMTKEIISAIDYSYIIDNKWIYPNEKADKDFFLNVIQQYQADLFDETDWEIYSLEDSLMILRIRKISEQVLKYYPQNVEALNNLGATYFFENNDSKALEIFLTAEQIAPNNDIVLFNIANIYAKRADKQKAKAYYENIIKNCNTEAKNQAKELLKEL